VIQATHPRCTLYSLCTIFDSGMMVILHCNMLLLRSRHVALSVTSSSPQNLVHRASHPIPLFLMLSCRLCTTVRVPRVDGARRTLITAPVPVTRPYRFHLGASWAGKPPDWHQKSKKKAAKELGFPAETEIGRWRAGELARFAFGAKGRQPGEDFFYASSMRDDSVGEHTPRCAIDACL
jgi:hypothetical protein